MDVDSSGDDEALLLAPVASGALDAAPLQPGAEQPRRRSDFRSEGRVVDATAWRTLLKGGRIPLRDLPAEMMEMSPGTAVARCGGVVGSPGERRRGAD